MKSSHVSVGRLRGLLLALALLLALVGLTTPVARAASLIVTNTNDSGAGSLRQAIADAASGDTITFSLPNPSTITLASQLTIDKNLTITGPGVSQLTISGNNTTRVFSVPAGITLNLSGVTVANGNAGSDSGGGIENRGTVAVSNSTFTGNKGHFGGAILTVDGSLTVSGSTFTGNSAFSAGAIEQINGTATVSNSTFTGNSAEGESGAIDNFEATMTISGSTFTGNSTGGDGGAVSNFFDSTLTLSNSTFTGNSAAGKGGAINDLFSTTRISNNTFTNNTAADGGGIYTLPDDLRLSSNRFINNRPGGNCSGVEDFNDNGGNRTDDRTCPFRSVPDDIRLSPSSVAEERPVGTTVGTLSTEAFGGSYTYALVSGAGDTDNGSFTISGTILKTAAIFDYETKNSYSIRVQLTDDLGLIVVENFTISVTDVVENRAPTAITLDPSSVAENQPAGTTVGTFSTTDPDTGNTFTYSLVGGTGSTDNGSFSIGGNTLKTAASFDYENNNSYSIRVRTTDNGGLFFEQVFTITVTDVNENVAPVANNDDVSTDEDTAVSGNVLTNDSDADGNTLTAIKVSDPSHGSITLNSDGSFTYTPAANYNGSDSFTYKANDGTADSNVATVSITVNAINDAPVATNDSFSTNEDTALTSNVLTNDTDVDRNTLTAVKMSDPSHGSVTLNSDGSFTYTPAANYSGPDSFSYKANDGAADSNVATVSLAVNAANDAPTIAVAAGGQCLSDSSGLIKLALSDADSSNLTLSSSSSNITLVPVNNIVLAGSGANRTATIRTASGKTGMAVVTITVSDGQASSSVTVTVQAGGNGNDTITGTDGSDILFGQNGDDTLVGKGGIDLLCGGRGNDTLTGAVAADSFDGGQGTDTTPDFNAAEGDTRVNIP